MSQKAQISRQVKCQVAADDQKNTWQMRPRALTGPRPVSVCGNNLLVAFVGEFHGVCDVIYLDGVPVLRSLSHVNLTGPETGG